MNCFSGKYYFSPVVVWYEKTYSISNKETRGWDICVWNADTMIIAAEPAEVSVYYLALMSLLDDSVGDFEQANVILMGSPGCGKTTAGQAVASRLGISAVDIDDDHLEPYWGTTVARKVGLSVTEVAVPKLWLLGYWSLLGVMK